MTSAQPGPPPHPPATLPPAPLTSPPGAYSGSGPGQPASPVPEASSEAPASTASTWPYLLLALLVLVLDQVSKYLVIDHFQYGERMPVIAGFFDLTLLYNPGAAFSFLAGHGGWQRWFFAAIAIGASLFLLYLLRQSRGRVLFSFALGLILGGAIGNLIDRLLLGHVTDFLLFYQGGWHFPAFNLADTAITIGAVLMIGEELLSMFRPRPSPAP